MARTEPEKTAGKRPRGMANLASTLTGRTDSLARRSTEEQLAPEPTPPPVVDPALVPAAPPIATPAPVSEVVTAGTATAPSVANEPAQAGAAARQSAAPARRRRPTASSLTPSRPFAGPEGRLEASGETVVKWTLELAPQLVMALNVWERDETKRLGERVFRERMIDQALDRLPEDLDDILSVVADLPATLRRAPGQQFGTRVRSSVRDKLLALRPELRVAGIKDVRIRDIYSAGVYQYLIGLGIAVDDTVPAPRNRETEKVS
jgi:hypothetical protein